MTVLCSACLRPRSHYPLRAVIMGLIATSLRQKAPLKRRRRSGCELSAGALGKARLVLPLPLSLRFVCAGMRKKPQEGGKSHHLTKHRKWGRNGGQTLNEVFHKTNLPKRGGGFGETSCLLFIAL